MIAFGYEPLWTKSQLFIKRAIQARDNKDALAYHLWAAIALELLGKAALAHVHPVLVADPNDFINVLAAFGRRDPQHKKTILAKTVFERLSELNPAFDDRMKRDCMFIANRRNSELHSGESPIVGLDERAWVPQLWKAVVTMLEMQGRTIDDWVGDEEGERVRKVIADSSELLRQTVLARIERRRREYERRFPPDRTERAEAITRAAARIYARRFASRADETEGHECPACKWEGLMFGHEGDREVGEVRRRGHEEEGVLFYHHDDYDEPDWYQTVTITYSVEGFECDECGLELDGAEECNIAGLPEWFERTEEQEPDWEADYGNE